MVTAILPSIVAQASNDDNGGHISSSSTAAAQLPIPERVDSHHSTSPSLSSELTITPARLASGLPSTSTSRRVVATTTEEPVTSSLKFAYPSRLAGFVGFATGCGALMALVLFLPLPARFSSFENISPKQAVTYSYCVVGIIALLIAGCCLVGLRDLPRIRKDRSKDQGTPNGEMEQNGQPTATSRAISNSRRALYDAVMIGLHDEQIGLGYLGGFVARYVLFEHPSRRTTH